MRPPRVVEGLWVVQMDLGEARLGHVLSQESLRILDGEPHVVQPALIGPARGIADHDGQEIDARVVVIRPSQGAQHRVATVPAPQLQDHRRLAAGDGDWAAPLVVRMALDGWDFAAATDAIEQAAAVVRSRDAIRTQAAAEGHARDTNQPGRTPFHGYYFRIVDAQGSAAVGGAKPYVVDGRMTGGFALVAWPVLTGVPAFVGAWIVAQVLTRIGVTARSGAATRMS